VLNVFGFFFLYRDKDYHLRTYKSVVMANKLIDWLIAQVKREIGVAECINSALNFEPVN
jgi:hypothetical protein